MGTAVFDLDGTISNPSEGITGAINYSLERLGHGKRPGLELEIHIGPPLVEVFSVLLPEGEREAAVGFFREYYSAVGYKQNFLYPGIREALHSLNHRGHRLCIATGKKAETARKVLDHFDLSGLFTKVLGCGEGGTKTGLILEVLKDCAGPWAMVGDRMIDFEAAAEAGIPSVGVRWGFGNPGELAGACVSVEQPSELKAALNTLLEK